MRRGFAPHFRHLDDLFAPQNLSLSTILFRSCWVPFRSPPFSACRRSFCRKNWSNLSFYSDLVGSHFELRAVHPYWFWLGVPPTQSFSHDFAIKLLKYGTSCHDRSTALTVLDEFFLYLTQMITSMRGCVTHNDLWAWPISSKLFSYDIAYFMDYIHMWHEYNPWGNDVSLAISRSIGQRSASHR